MNRRPSPALVISIVALFVALGGTSYAAVKLNGKNIKRGTVAGTALKKNTLTGTQIRESKLGKVPKATRADSAGAADTAGFAASAGNATAVGGIPAAAIVQGPATVLGGNVTIPTSSSGAILNLPGLLTISGSCNSSNELSFNFESQTASVRALATLHRTTAASFTTGGTLDDNESFTLPNYAAQQLTASIFKVGSPTAGATVNGATTGCTVGLIATLRN